jgi:DNA-binding transcriptional regulator YhcF (GntR family)
MDIVLNRKGGVPLRDQLLAQLELRILAGALAPGQRLPSVRALARKLGLHPNTVSAAYRDLEDAGQLEARRGAGVFVRADAPASLDEARGLDEIIRLALRAAFRRGHSGPAIRAAIERWLKAAPPERVVVVDPQRETVELVTHEVRTAVGVPATGCTLEELREEPSLLSGALAVTFPYHAAKVAKLAPEAAVQTVHVEGPLEARKTVLAVPAGATILIVSRSPVVLKFSAALVGGLRGDEVLVETRVLARRAEWRRLVPAADVVLADVLSAPAVAEARPRRLRELRLLGPSDLERIRETLAAAIPGNQE